MFLCDYHIHTKYSFDGDPAASVRSICLAAIEKGLTDIAITDHFEVNSEPEGLGEEYDSRAAYLDVMQAKEEFAGRLNVTYGIELGQATQYPEITKKFLSEHPLEFVLASLHNLRGRRDFYYMDFKTISEEETDALYTEYLSELTEIINTFGDRIDSIGHITYPYRYDARAGKVIDCSKHNDELSRVFSLLISKDIAIELNMSTHTKGYGFTMPHNDVLALYRECGGRLITLGNDAHSPTMVGASIPLAVEIVKEYGFDSALVVRNGQKELIKLS